MTGLLHAPYTPGQMTYDLRRLRLDGLIHRIEGTNSYGLTPDGTSSPSSTPSSTTGCCAPSSPPTSPRHPPNQGGPAHPHQHIEDYIARARLGTAA